MQKDFKMDKFWKSKGMNSKNVSFSQSAIIGNENNILGNEMINPSLNAFFMKDPGNFGQQPIEFFDILNLQT